MQQLVLLDVLDVASRIDKNTYGRVAAQWPTMKLTKGKSPEPWLSR